MICASPPSLAAVLDLLIMGTCSAASFRLSVRYGCRVWYARLVRVKPNPESQVAYIRQIPGGAELPLSWLVGVLMACLCSSPPSPAWPILGHLSRSIRLGER